MHEHGKHDIKKGSFPVSPFPRPLLPLNFMRVKAYRFDKELGFLTCNLKSGLNQIKKNLFYRSFPANLTP